MPSPIFPDSVSLSFLDSVQFLGQLNLVATKQFKNHWSKKPNLLDSMVFLCFENFSQKHIMFSL